MHVVAALIEEHKTIKKFLLTLQYFKDNLPALKDKQDDFIRQTVDFFRTFADECHHGKEEKILFSQLKNKNLLPNEQTMLNELIAEHVKGRALIAKIEKVRGEELKGLLESLIALYKQHIYKEENKFFRPAFLHFSKAEQDKMKIDFLGVDKAVLYSKYLQVVNNLSSFIGMK